MQLTWAESLDAFTSAAEWFVATAEGADGRWAEPGLGEWDVRALVGHTSRALLTVESYLATPPERVDLDSPVAYYGATRPMAAGAAVAQRGRDAGQALGDDPVVAVAAIAERVVPLVQRCTGEELLTTIAGGMRLADYLPTRTFELVVHTCDLAAALGQPADPPAVAARAALALAGDLVIDEGHAGEVLLALTGRRPLRDGYSLV
ncbi:MAG TPA: maleylpyruvate isomerase N-terminal domain-containing protein [Propionibacteriaceae bacterium]|nr:maleylpyruvate isomerase N-terminal domain-containing protein [Propionibacteriaceae bacterium]